MSSYKKNLLNLQRSQYVLYILVLTLVLVVIWIGGTLLTSQRSSGIDAQTRRMAQPLNPNIDAQVLADIAEKKVFDSEELFNFPIYMLTVGTDGSAQQIVPIGTDVLNDAGTSLSDIADQAEQEAAARQLELEQSLQQEEADSDDTVDTAPEDPNPETDPAAESDGETE